MDVAVPSFLLPKFEFSGHAMNGVDHDLAVFLSAVEALAVVVRNPRSFECQDLPSRVVVEHGVVSPECSRDGVALPA